MRVTWIGWVVLVAFGIGCDSVHKKPEPAPGSAAAIGAPAPDARASAAGVSPAGSAAAADKPPPRPMVVRLKLAPPGVDALFPERQSADDSLSDQLQRRIRFRLRDRSKAPIALHHIVNLERSDGGREVFALYEFSAYEDCMTHQASRQEGRARCLGEMVSVYDADEDDEVRIRTGNKYRYKQIRLNRECVGLGAVRARFAPAGPNDTSDTANLVALSSFAFPDACQIRTYNHLFVADVDGDDKLEMYIDITTAREIAGEVNGHYTDSMTVKMYDSHRHLYILPEDDISRAELSMELDRFQVVSDGDADPSAADKPVDLYDIDHDGHLDVIQTKPCVELTPTGPGAPCSPEQIERLAYLYDAASDAYKPGVPASVTIDEPPRPAVPATPPGAPAPAAGSGAPAPAAGSGAPSPGPGSGAPVPAAGSGAPAPAAGSGAPAPAAGSGALRGTDPKRVDAAVPAQTGHGRTQVLERVAERRRQAGGRRSRVNGPASPVHRGREVPAGSTGGRASSSGCWRR